MTTFTMGNCTFCPHQKYGPLPYKKLEFTQEDKEQIERLLKNAKPIKRLKPRIKNRKR